MSRCHCGTVWLNPAPVPEDIPRLYDGYYTHSAGVERRPTKSLPRSILARLSLRFSSDLRYLGHRQPGALLDVGCGNGAFLAVAKEAGWAVNGCEVDPAAAEVAGQIADVRVGSLRDLRYPRMFDAVTMSNVLEHLPDPAETMAEVRRILKPCGVFVSISPNPDSFLHGRYRQSWRGLEVPRHIALFPPRALRSMAMEAGFAHCTAFSTLGSFDQMDEGSRQIAGRGRPVPRWQRALVRGATLMGHEIGEWSVLVAT